MPEILGVYHDVNPCWNVAKGRGHGTLVCVTEGKVNYRIGKETMELGKGEALIIPSSMERTWTNHPEETHSKYTVLFTEDELSSRYVPARESIRMKLRNIAYFEQRVAVLFLQWLGKKPYSEDMSEYILLELLATIAQERTERRGSPAKERIARKIQEYILHHYRQNITIEELAGLAGITPNYITVLFKEVIGVTPIQYMHKIRINTALQLLENTRMTVGEVAEYLGYCDQAYFNRMFKKLMGIAPTLIRSRSMTREV